MRQMDENVGSVFFPKWMLGETKDVLCISCGAKQKMFYPCDKDSFVYGLFTECPKCGHWFQINIEAGRQKPIGKPPEE